MKAADVTEGMQLRQRHKNNPRGAWQPLSSLAQRLPQRDVMVLVGGDWQRVEFGRGGARRGAGRPEGIEEATPRKKKEKKKDREKIDSKVDA